MPPKGGIYACAFHSYLFKRRPDSTLFTGSFSFYSLRDKDGTYSRAGLIITDNAVWSVWLFGLCLLLLSKLLRKIGHAGR